MLAFVVAAVGLEAMRSGLERSEALRENIEAAAEAQLGTALRAGAIEVDFFPATLVLRGAVLELSGRTRVTLDETRVGVDLESLLRGNARMRGLAVSGPARFEHPQLGSAALEGDLDLAIVPGAPPLDWALELEGRLASGGTFAAHGGFGAGGAFDGSIEISEVEGAPFAPFLTSDQGEPARLSGRFGGAFELARDGSLATLRLASARAEIALAPVVVRGPIALVAWLPGTSSSDGEGRFAIDASGARVEYAGGLAKASGQSASLTGRIVRAPNGGLQLEEVGLKVQKFQGEVSPGGGGRGETGDEGGSERVDVP